MNNNLGGNLQVALVIVGLITMFYDLSLIVLETQGKEL